MGWMKFVAEQVRDRGRIYMDEPTIDLWVLQHGWDFPVRYMAVAAATGSVAVPTITAKTAWRLLRLARHQERLKVEHAFDYGKGITATTRLLVDGLRDLGYDTESNDFTKGHTWGQAQLAKTTPPLGSGGA